MRKVRLTVRDVFWPRAAIAVVALAICAGHLRAQTPRANQFFRREQFLEEETRRRLDANIPKEQKAIVTWGGYIIPQWQQYDDVRKQSNFRQIDLRLWGNAVIDDVHHIYARMKLAHTNFGPGDSPFGWNQDLEGPNLDQGYYELRLSKALEKYGNTKVPFDSRITVGRQFVEFGNGLSLSKVLDGGTFSVETGQWRATGLFATTIRSDTNIDLSPVVADHMDRTLGGLQIDCLALSGHQPFAYFIVQHDSTEEEPENLNQEYDYDSNYFGFGSNGEVVQNLRYATEVVFETGQSERQNNLGSSRIRAFAFDQLLEYYIPHKTEPVVGVEYAVASGDRDRTSANATIAGNLRGHDNAFLSMGYINTGYAFAPAFTNLQFVRTGVRFKPFPDCKALKRLELGTDFYWFMKQKRKGPMSDFRADTNATELGTEVDIYANYRIFSDLAIIVRYGRFWTGEAYSDDEIRDYLYAGLLYSF